jgi:hypothetical protein
LTTDESPLEHAVKSYVEEHKGEGAQESGQAKSDYGNYSLGEFDKFDYKKQVFPPCSVPGVIRGRW